jgi:hypothetical protein
MHTIKGILVAEEKLIELGMIDASNYALNSLGNKYPHEELHRIKEGMIRSLKTYTEYNGVYMENTEIEREIRKMFTIEEQE